jgi:hypothetical protein
MNITITTVTLDKKVQKQLAFIGKHFRSADGKNSFSFSTPSSAELSVLHDYYADGVIYLNSMSQYFVTAATSPSDPEADGSAVGTITLTFPTNHNEQMNNTIKLIFISFLVAYALYAWASVTAPQLTDRFKRDLQDKLESLFRLIWYKAPPGASYDDSVPPVINAPSVISIGDGDVVTIDYTVGTDGIDDIVVTSGDVSKVSVSKSSEDRRITLTGHNRVEGTTANVTVSFTSESHPESNRTTAVSVVASESVAPETVTPTVINGVLPGGSSTLTFEEGESKTLVIVPGSKGLGTITFTNNNPDKVAIVYWVGSASLTVTAIKEGNWSVVFNNSLYPGSYTMNFAVSESEEDPDHGDEPTEDPSWVVAPPQSVELEVNGAERIYRYMLGSDGIDSLVFSVGDTSKVAVSKNSTRREFVLTPIGAGITTVSFVDLYHPSMNRTLRVTVTEQGQSPTPQSLPQINPQNWNAIPHEITRGQSSMFQFAYSGSDERFNPPEIIATSSNQSVLTVSVNAGVVTVNAVGVGTATVTCRRQGYQETLATVSYTVIASEADNPRWLNLQSSYELTMGQSGVTLAYELGTDGIDSVQASNVGSLVTVTKDESRHFFYIAPVSTGSTTVTFTDENHPNMNVTVYVVVADSGGVDPYAIPVYSGETDVNVTLKGTVNVGGTDYTNPQFHIDTYNNAANVLLDDSYNTFTTDDYGAPSEGAYIGLYFANAEGLVDALLSAASTLGYTLGKGGTYYTVLSSTPQASTSYIPLDSTPSPSNPLPDGVYYLRCADMEVEAGVTVNNPVIQVEDGVVRCGFNEYGNIYSYKPASEVYEAGMYFPRSSSADETITRRAVKAIADMGYVVEAAGSGDRRAVIDTSHLPVGMIPAEDYEYSD